MIKIENAIYQQDDLRNAEYVGEVINVDDPKQAGRCKIRVYGKFDELPDANLPWAYPEANIVFSSSNGGSGRLSVPRVGTMVKVTFFNGDLYSPVFTGIMNQNAAMLSEIASSYTNAQVICYDEDEQLKIYYTQAKGLYINLKGSTVVISPQNDITLRTAVSTGPQILMSNDGRISINNDSENLKEIIKELMTAIIAADIIVPNGKGVIGPDTMQTILKLQIRLLKLLK
jgi:hypothetical protein